MSAGTGWFVYLMRCSDGSLYCGVTTDLARRLAEHNAGTGARYTRSRRPVALEASAPCADKSAALRAEAAVRRHRAEDKAAYVHELARAEEQP
ncbi:GIY-YIG nuclease family protein [Desulfovibrio aminophilus]|nr:GIY-YIG nuclease family protein [Desulfovibrio aminophilus]MCM0756305.1 GIY-YIG nuclease family protein [Desulfovibrio aminophilus]